MLDELGWVVRAASYGPIRRLMKRLMAYGLAVQHQLQVAKYGRPSHRYDLGKPPCAHAHLVCQECGAILKNQASRKAA